MERTGKTGPPRNEQVNALTDRQMAWGRAACGRAGGRVSTRVRSYASRVLQMSKDDYGASKSRA